MKKKIKILFSFIVLTQSTFSVIACGNNPDSDGSISFQELSGTTDEIANVMITNDGKFYATSKIPDEEEQEIDNEAIYYSVDHKSFNKIEASEIEASITAVESDNKSNFYLATDGDEDEKNGGIYKYDGEKFEKIKGDFFDDKSVISLFFSSKNNEMYCSVTDSGGTKTDVYKFNIDNEEEPENIIKGLDGTLSKLVVDENQNVYVITNVAGEENYNGLLFKITASKETKLVEKNNNYFYDITLHNNIIYYVRSDSSNPEKNQTFVSWIDDEEEKSKDTGIKTEWDIKKIVIDKKNHIFAGGENANLFSGTIENIGNIVAVPNFRLIAGQEFNNIESLNYRNDTLLIGTKDKVFSADISKF